MSTEAFRLRVENHEEPLDTHEKRICFAYCWLLDELWHVDGIFAILDDTLHWYDWTIGEGPLKGNRCVLRLFAGNTKNILAEKMTRTLDLFYLSNLATAIYRHSNNLQSPTPEVQDFDRFYDNYHYLLGEDVWKEYYSYDFLTHPDTARKYRLPNLQDLGDSAHSLCGPRLRQEKGHHTKLPRWAWCVVQEVRQERNDGIDKDKINDIALRTLKETADRLHDAYPTVVLYSATQTRFWLNYMKRHFADADPSITQLSFEVYLTQGGIDVWIWEAFYSPELWFSEEAGIEYVQPDRDGLQKPTVVRRTGGDDVEREARGQGWIPEMGSKEEVMFLKELESWRAALTSNEQIL